MQIGGQEVINNLLNEWGSNWQSVDELAKLPEGDARLHLLQQHFPHHDVHDLTRADVVHLLEREYWTALHANDIASPAVAESIIRAVLYLGLADAVHLAQQVVDVPADGIMGPQTLRAINSMDENEFYSRYNKEVMNFINANKSAAMENELPFGEAALKSTHKADDSLNATPNFNAAQQFAQQAATEPEDLTSLNETPQPGPDRFDVDAIIKKSTSDIWTIEDRLGYDTYANTIAYLILKRKAEPPLTVSIQAPWGQGKTSLMRMIKHKLEHGLAHAQEDARKPAQSNDEVPGTQSKLNNLKNWIEEEVPKAETGESMLTQTPDTIPCVWFNPLYFQDSNQVWSGLAHAILKQLVDKLPNQLEKERFWFRLRMARIDTNAVRRDIHKLILERWLPKGLVWLGLFLILGIYSFTHTELGQYLQQHVWAQLSPIFGGIGHFIYQWFSKNKDWSLDDKLTKYIKEPDYTKDMGLLHLVDHDLDRALRLLLGEEGRLAVFIDDLDRCSPETVNDILLAINQFISVQHRKLYFILGMDTHMVAMAIESASEKQAAAYNKNRHTSKGYGWRFMEKFVQLPFFIPRIQPQKAEAFLDTLLREKRMETVEKAAIDDVKDKIAGSANLEELQDVVTNFKKQHNVDVLPEMNASVAAKIIDITSDQQGETLNKLVSAAMTDLELNPREIKRFLNVVRLLFTRVDIPEDIASQTYMLKIVRAAHLVLNWPQCLRWLQGNARSYTVQGAKTDPVENLEDLFNNPGIDNFEKWSKTIEDTWGETVADTIAQPDFYTFCRRIHDNPPNLRDIFEAQIF